MDIVLQKVLDSGIASMEYSSSAGFPTRALLTRNINYMPDYIDRMVFMGGSFLEAFDLLRERKITILSSQRVFNFISYNPANLLPSEMLNPSSMPSKFAVESYRKSFIKDCGEMVTRGDPMLLNKSEKKTLLSLFAAVNADDFDDMHLDESMEDLKFSRQEYKAADKLALGYFIDFHKDMSDRESVPHAAKKWLSVVKIYAKLSLMEDFLSPKDRELIEGIKYPGPKDFKTEEDVIRYWPYALSPRPNELPLVYETDNLIK
jgi:hypothetical protein